MKTPNFDKKSEPKVETRVHNVETSEEAIVIEKALRGLPFAEKIRIAADVLIDKAIAEQSDFSLHVSNKKLKQGRGFIITVTLGDIKVPEELKK